MQIVPADRYQSVTEMLSTLDFPIDESFEDNHLSGEESENQSESDGDTTIDDTVLQSVEKPQKKDSEKAKIEGALEKKKKRKRKNAIISIVIAIFAWNNTLQSIPTARYNAISFAFKDSIYFVGGQNNSESNSKEIFVYDKSSGTWKASANSFPAAMRYGFAVVANNVVFAGLGEASQKALWHSSDLITWTVIDNLPSSIGTVLSGVYDSARNSIFMIDNNSKIWEYELSADKWISHSAFPYTEKNYHMFVLNGNIYILGQHMVYVAWATVLAGLLFMRRNRIVLALAALFGGIILFVSGLNWMDPEINPLVPVLKSPWLMFHGCIFAAHTSR